MNRDLERKGRWGRRGAGGNGRGGGGVLPYIILQCRASLKVLFFHLLREGILFLAIFDTVSKNLLLFLNATAVCSGNQIDLIAWSAYKRGWVGIKR